METSARRAAATTFKALLTSSEVELMETKTTTEGLPNWPALLLTSSEVELMETGYFTVYSILFSIRLLTSSEVELMETGAVDFLTGPNTLLTSSEVELMETIWVKGIPLGKSKTSDFFGS